MTLYELLNVIIKTCPIDVIDDNDVVINDEMVAEARIPFYLLQRNVSLVGQALAKGEDSDSGWTRSKIVIYLENGE